MAFAGGFPGKTPRTPHPRILKTKVGEVQREAIKGNIEAFPDIGKLGDLYSKDDLARIEQLLPGYGENLSAGSATTQALLSEALPYLHGEIPQDVQDQIQRSSAYQALSGGYAGSPMARALTARDLGLTSLDLQSRGAQMAGQGANTMQAWDAIARRGMLNPASMLVTPGQAISVDQQNRINMYNALQNSYNIQAQPHPLHGIIMGLTEAYLGSMGGGMGGPKTDSPATDANATSDWRTNASSATSGAPVNFNYTNQYIPNDSLWG